MASKNKDVLYDYLLHYNPYIGKWHAFKRDKKEAYFNGELDKVELTSDEDITKLIAKLLAAKSS